MRGETLPLSLPEAIMRARSHSVEAAVALGELRQAYWEFRSYRASLLPEVNFSATAPGYYHQYSSYMDSEGRFSFVPNNYMNLSAGISVDQRIWLTGGSLALTTKLDFLRQFSGTVYNRFLSVPVSLELTQPIFGINTVKWDRRIEPVRYREAKAKFLSATEKVAMEAITYYFSLLLSQESLQVSTQNLANAQKLYEVAVVKREMGQISKNDLLQMELNVLDARAALTDAKSAVRRDMFALRAFLDYDESITLEPSLPQSVPTADISYADALEKALENNQFSRNIRRRQLEADYAVAQAKAQLRKIDLFASVGLTGTDHIFAGAYNLLKSNQVVEVGVKIPLIDWGRRRGQVKVAQSNRQVVESRLRQEQLAFNQDLFILVERYTNQREQVAVAARADSIAVNRYNSNVETYLIGKISTLDLKDSQLKKDQSRQDYVSRLYYFWLYYYQLRSLTLWDYSDNSPIEADFEYLIKNH